MTEVDPLLAALAEGETVKRRRTGGCTLCDWINTQSEERKSALIPAAAGTIGRDALVRIIAPHNTGYPIGNRTVERHRNEGHTP